MCDQTSLVYKPGDIVWVKFGTCWWPGEVVVNEETEVLKKPPLAVVKFFQETSYEYVKNLNQIYSYNCSKKIEFIRKGMNMYKEKKSFMENFPADVITAESKTNGDLNILNDPKLAPPKKIDYSAIFGSPKKESPSKPKKKLEDSKAFRHVTHPRFIGVKNDFEVHLRPQNPEKSDPQETMHTCLECAFHTKRIDVMVVHNKAHLEGWVNIPRKKKSKTSAKKRKIVPKSIKNLEESDEDISDDIPKKKRKPRNNLQQKPKSENNKQKPKTVEEDKPIIDVRTDLLAEWDDSDSADDMRFNVAKDSVIAGGSDKDSDEDSNKSLERITKTEESTDTTDKNMENRIEESHKKDDHSCFDFIEEEESISVDTLPAASGRKIPRVIPPSDKRQSSEKSLDGLDKNSVSDKTENNLSPSAEMLNKDNDISEKHIELDKEDADFNAILDSTSVPNLPEIPQTLKWEQNFHLVKTIKFPDKNSESEDITKTDGPTNLSLTKPKESENSKIINPKKRFVKSFEDYEFKLNEKNKSKEISELNSEKIEADNIVESNDKNQCTNDASSNPEDLSNIEIPLKRDSDASELILQTVQVSKLKTQLMNKLKDPKEQEEIQTTDPPIEKTVNFFNKKLKMAVNMSLETITASSDDSDVAAANRFNQEEIKKNFNENIKSFAESLLNNTLQKTETVFISNSAESSSIADQTESFLPAPTISPTVADDITENATIDTISSVIETSKINSPQTEITSKDLVLSQANAELKEENVCLHDKNVAISETLNDFSKDIDEENMTMTSETSIKVISEHSNETFDVEEQISLKENFISDAGSNIEASSNTLIESNCDENKTENKPPRKLSSRRISSNIKEMNTSNMDATNPEESIKTDVNVDPNESLSSVKLVDIKELPATRDSENNLVSHDSEKHITVINENDLVNSEVEIAKVSVDINNQPITMSAFSMDFADYEAAKLEVNSNNENNKNKIEVQYTSEQEKNDIIQAPEVPDLTSLQTNKIENFNSSLLKEISKSDDQTPSSCIDNKNSVELEMAKLTNTDPNIKPVPVEISHKTSSSKLLDILTDNKNKSSNVLPKKPQILNKAVVPSVPKTEMSTLPKLITKNSKFIIKSATPGTSTTSKAKAVFLQDRCIKPHNEPDVINVQKLSSKRSFDDVEDIDAFIIQKPKKVNISESDATSLIPIKTAIKKPVMPKCQGKPRIIQQTIITPTGDIIQPRTQDDFDINSMPIVLSDQILTPESIENIPIVLSETMPSTSAPKDSETKKSQSNIKILNRTSVSSEPTTKTTISPTIMRHINKKQIKPGTKIYQTSGTKFLKHNPAIMNQPGKPGKFIIVPSAPSPTGSKYTVGKKQIVKKASPSIVPGTNIGKIPSSEPSGNKIMIVTNNQGQQSRVLLTPAQQKLFGYQSSGKLMKGTIKTTLQKNLLRETVTTGTTAKIGNVSTQQLINVKSQIPTLAASNALTPANELKSLKIDPKTKKVQLPFTQKICPKPINQTRTVILKTQGQSVKKFQDSNDALLEKQVAEQIQAINKANEQQQLTKSKTESFKTNSKYPLKKSYHRKQIPIEVSKQTLTNISGVSNQSLLGIPALAPLSPSKRIDGAMLNPVEQVHTIPEQKQYVIQDALGNQTTITEGQILAFPSETVDGQPQSYMLVTVDESGNLKPLNNEALMTLDPNLQLGGDIGNMVLQLEQGTGSQNPLITSTETLTSPIESSGKGKSIVTSDRMKSLVNRSSLINPQLSSQAKPELEKQSSSSKKMLKGSSSTLSKPSSEIENNTMQSIACNLTSGETSQQLIITGDPMATQKLLESLSEGNTDLANVLANAEGSILIHADGQDIIINATGSSNNQTHLLCETVTTTTNHVFGNQPLKNQDILAAALADTDVFQQEQTVPISSKVSHSQLSPNNSIFPINVGNVLETTAMNSPIMTPLEVPSTNSKKVEDLNILTQVPKNVDLPITITDPNISQTVAQQQVASLMASELQNTLELPLALSDSAVVSVTEMNNPYVYSLPSLQNSEIAPKSFSMPLLSEDLSDQDTSTKTNKLSDCCEPTDSKNEVIESAENSKTDPVEVETSGSATNLADNLGPQDSKEEGECGISKNIIDEPLISNSDVFVETSLEDSVSADIKPDITTEPYTLEKESEFSENESNIFENTEEKQSIFEVRDSKYAEDDKPISEPFLGSVSDRLCSMRATICNSLSEPPPDMFDFSLGQTYDGSLNNEKHTSDIDVPDSSTENTNDSSIGNNINDIGLLPQDTFRNETNSEEMETFEQTKKITPTYAVLNTDLNSPSTNNTDENSCEIPVQPQIVTNIHATSFENKFNSENSSHSDFVSKKKFDNEDGSSSKCKFD